MAVFCSVSSDRLFYCLRIIIIIGESRTVVMECLAVDVGREARSRYVMLTEPDIK